MTPGEAHLAELLRDARLPRLRVSPQGEPGLLGELNTWWFRVGPAHPSTADGSGPLPAAIVLGPTTGPLVDLARRTGIGLIDGLAGDQTTFRNVSGIDAWGEDRLAEGPRADDPGADDPGADDPWAEAMRSGCEAAAAALTGGTAIACCLTPGPALDPSALALIGAAQPTDACALIGLPAAADAEQERQWADLVVHTRDVLRRVRSAEPGWPALIAAGSAQVCAAVGVLLTAAARRVPVMLDGVSAVAAGHWLASQSRGLAGWWRTAGSLSCPGAALVDDVLGVPLLDTRQPITDGRVGLLAVELLRLAPPTH
ncbi:MAG: nicotinate-nucleotide--dimethylbenzimidazole phosphoribosyltransferase [Actinomycetales bacterium]|nr:nicotinate-nucleotide--dimethylbenzimidazole phosphoribosyltransferase [Actinomycetales bacterium]